MSTENSEIKLNFGRCRCCLNYDYIKYMWKQYENEDDVEVYGEILTECFALSWENPESMEHDQICDSCVNRLKDAYDFRNLVIKSQLQLTREIENDISIEEQNVIYLEEAIDETLEKVEVTCENDDDVKVKVEEDSVDMGCAENLEIVYDTECDEKEVVIYENVEYLEEEGLKNKQITRMRASAPKENGGRRSKRPKAAPPTDRNKRYMQYTAEDMLKAIEAVRNNRMSRLEASQYFKVPRKTLAIRVKEAFEMVQKDPSHELMEKFIKEIKMILTYTNATPYRSKVTSYACMYCNEGVYVNPAELRDHTRTVHFEDKIKKLDMVMRPHWLNEIIKLDVQNLLCVVCCIPITEWNAALKHLVEVHKVVLEQAYGKIIPYCLESKLKCVLCKESFDYYHQLDIHMNAHYDNYVCVYCGETYLSENRLKGHMAIHSDKKLLCRYCSKIFKSRQNLMKHVSIMHNTSNCYKCLHCDEKFPNKSLRRKHLTEVHGDKVEKYTCEFCGQSFNLKRSYVQHMGTHSARKWPCQFCHKTFNSNSNLSKHEQIVHKRSPYFKCMHCEARFETFKLRKDHMTEVHRDKLKAMTCEFCGKEFNWMQYYLGHMKRVHGNRTYQCTKCDKCYVLKTDLNNHYAIRHGEAKKYKCTHCDKLYSSRPGLTAHLKQHK